MTEVAQHSDRAAEPDQSATEQAKEKVQEGAEQVQQKAQEVKVRAGGRMRQELDDRSTQAGTQLRASAGAMRRAGEQLRSEGNDGPAKITDAVATRAERLGDYMTEANADRMIRDVEEFARRQPWLVAFGGLALGFLASRFVKASSSGRYEPSGRTAGSASASGFVSQPGLEPGMAAFTEEESYVAPPGATAGETHGRPQQ